MFTWEYSPHGCYLFDDGTFGYIGDPEFDPEDFLEDGETEDDLIRDGRRPIGNIYIDRWTKDGEFIQGGCFLYYEGETMKDYCDRNGEPHPVREFYATLDKGEDAPASDGRMTEKEIVAVYYKRLVEAGVEKKLLKDIFGHAPVTLDAWAGIDTTRKKKTPPAEVSSDPKT